MCYLIVLNKQIMKVAIVGGGYWGKNVIKTCQDLESVDEIVVVDLDPTIRQRNAGQPKITQVTDSLDGVTYDRVCICTPPNSHLKLAAQATKPVYIEKPVTASLKELQNFKSPQPVFTPHIMLEDSTLKRVSAYLSNSKAQIVSIRIDRCNWGIVREDVDVVFDLMLHDIAVAYTWTGANHALVKGCAYTRQQATAQLEMNYISVDIHASWTSRQRIRRYEIHLNDGSSVSVDLTRRPSEAIQVFQPDQSSYFLDVVPGPLSLTQLLRQFCRHPDAWESMHRLPFAKRVLETCQRITNLGQQNADVKFFDLKPMARQRHAEIMHQFNRILETQQFTQGSYLAEVEQKTAELLNARHAIFVSNGTVALEIALKALDIKPQDQVIVPAFTFMATAAAVSNVGAQVVFADVDSVSMNVTPETIQAKLSPSTKAVIGVSLFGRPFPAAAVKAILPNTVTLIEDGCQSAGASDNFDHCAMSVTSFYPSKPLTCFGEGGAIFTADAKVAEKLRMLRNHGMGQTRYVHHFTATNAKMSNWEAAVILAQLPHFKTYLNQRRRIAQYYHTYISQSPILQLPPISSSCTFSQFTVRCATPDVRSRFQQFLTERNIPFRIFYDRPLYTQPAFDTLTQVEPLPNTERLCKTVLTLPLYPDMPMIDIQHVVSIVNQFIATESAV